jgi:hypothetical protein
VTGDNPRAKSDVPKDVASAVLRAGGTLNALSSRHYSRTSKRYWRTSNAEGPAPIRPPAWEHVEAARDAIAQAKKAGVKLTDPTAADLSIGAASVVAVTAASHMSSTLAAVGRARNRWRGLADPPGRRRRILPPDPRSN